MDWWNHRGNENLEKKGEQRPLGSQALRNGGKEEVTWIQSAKWPHHTCQGKYTWEHCILSDHNL